MGKLTVQFEPNGQPIDLASLIPSLKDLSQASSDLPFNLGGALAALADKVLSSVGDGTAGTLGYAVSPSWKNLAGSPATFTLQAGATATITVRSKGHLLSYQSSFDSTQPKVNFDGKTGDVYIVTELVFNISGDLTANAPIGATGVTVTTNDTGSAKFIVRNYKAFSPTETVKNAVMKAIAGFTLPLHAATVSNLDDGDALYYEFDGALNVGFGVNYGISGSVGGYSLSEISRSMQTVGTYANISAKQTLTAAANVGVSLGFNWSRTFTCFLERNKPGAEPGSARLHLLTGTDTQRSFELKANGGITKITAPALTVNTAALTQMLLQKATGKAAPNVPQSVTDAVDGEVQKYVTDANDWLSSLTKKAQADGQISLSLLFQNSTQDTNAFTWDFDLANDNFDAAWKIAVSGDFVAALKNGAATLEAGSGFESVHTRNTNCTLTFFGLSNETLESYFSKSSMRYGGDGVFYLENQVGKQLTTSSKTKSSSTSIYLDATASSSTGDGNSGSISGNIQVQLHGILTTKGDKNQTSRLGVLLHQLGIGLLRNGGQAVISAGDAFKSLATSAANSAAPGASTVHIIYQMSALSRLQSDAYANGKQAMPPHALDGANWDAFAAASALPSTAPAAYLQSRMSNNFYTAYSSWEAFNRITNGFTDGQGATGPQFKTDRRASIGLLIPSNMASLREQPPFSPALSDIDCTELSFYCYAGQQYMNLCDDVRQVVTPAGASKLDWPGLMAQLEQLVDKDVDAWYGPAVLLALVKSTQASAAAVQQSKLDPSTGSGTVVISVA